MSIQEVRFTEIANAIREKDGTTAPIRALDFANRIRAISGGGSCGISILDEYSSDFVIYKGYIQLPEYTVAICDIGCDVLEEYP